MINCLMMMTVSGLLNVNNILNGGDLSVKRKLK